MQLTRLRASGFRSIGLDPVELTFEKLTFLLGPNGTGKTVFLHALARMFGTEASMRRFVAADFHVPLEQTPADAATRSLWLEADFAFPELLDAAAEPQPTVAPHFAHMRMEASDERPTVRFRLTASLEETGEVVDEFVYVLAADANDVPTRTAKVNFYDRAAIQVHYLPARRDPAQHVSYTANTLIGRLLRAADWQAEQVAVAGLSANISQTLAANAAVADMATRLTTHWQSVHAGAFLTNTGLSFLSSEIEGLLRHVTIEFTPGPGQVVVDFSLLSDGQQSLLYITLVLTAHAIGRDALAGQLATFDLDRLRPPVFTLLAVEEPENSLSPHYLGRVLNALRQMTRGHDAQAVVATHSASLMRRVDPEEVRYLRLDVRRQTTVAWVVLPAEADEAHKFVREALHAYPELYFARLVVLGEGDSEEVVLPRCLRSAGLETDATSVSVVPLGGRHVNHFWRLLNGLGIPHVTLLDLDLGRHQGGWGRIKYAAGQLLRYSAPPGLTQQQVDGLATEQSNVRDPGNRGWVNFLETHGVFFSDPLDLDFAMLEGFPNAYGLRPDERQAPIDNIVTAVLGDTGDASAYSPDEQALFLAYHRRFKLGSKPAHHVGALAELTDAELEAAMPAAIRRLIEQVAARLRELPE